MKRTSTSLRVFRKSMMRLDDGTLDVSGVISRQCYQNWMDLKNVSESDEEALKFRRTLVSHVAGSDGRCPFDVEEEEAILILLRKKMSWPCFPSHLAHLGMRYRSRGFHERRLQQEQQEAMEVAVLEAVQAAAVETAAVEAAAVHAAAVEAAKAAAAAADADASDAPVSVDLEEEEKDEDNLNHEEDEEKDLAAEALAAKLVHDAFVDNVNQMLTKLQAHDASFLTHLGDLAVCNFTFDFSFEDQTAIYDVLRFTILGRTACCRKEPASLSTAQHLCNNNPASGETSSDGAMTLVLDMTAKSFGECVLTQSAASKRWIGNELDECYARIMQRNDLFRLVLAICGAFHEPGSTFLVTKQEIVCNSGGTKRDAISTKYFDTTYFVDPESFLLIITANEQQQ